MRVPDLGRLAIEHFLSKPAVTLTLQVPQDPPPLVQIRQAELGEAWFCETHKRPALYFMTDLPGESRRCCDAENTLACQVQKRELIDA